jgi:hypothetical protein
MLPLKQESSPGSPISWFRSEIATESPVSTAKLERVVVFLVLPLDPEINDQEFWHDLKSISDVLASRDRLPGLRGVSIVVGFRGESSSLLDGLIRQKSRSKVCVGSAQAEQAFGEATKAIAARGLDSFEIKWELHETNPWYWY